MNSERHEKNKSLAQSFIGEFSNSTNSGLEILIDDREDKEIAESLEDNGITVRRKRLDVGDFLISNKILVERKKSSDFEKSIIDGRLFEQARRLSELKDEGIESSIILIEGSAKPLRIHKNAYLGALISLILDFNMQLFFTRDIKETADLLSLIAKREQKERKRPIRLISKRKASTITEEKLIVLQSFPKVGPTLSKKLLEKFGSLESIFKADEKELAKVIGKSKAEEIKSLIRNSNTPISPSN